MQEFVQQLSDRGGIHNPGSPRRGCGWSVGHTRAPQNAGDLSWCTSSCQGGFGWQKDEGQKTKGRGVPIFLPLIFLPAPLGLSIRMRLQRSVPRSKPRETETLLRVVQWTHALRCVKERGCIESDEISRRNATTSLELCHPPDVSRRSSLVVHDLLSGRCWLAKR